MIKSEVRTRYQRPLVTFLVTDPLRNPRVSGRPIAAAGFLKTSKRNSGRLLGDMVKSKSKSKRVKGRIRPSLNDVGNFGDRWPQRGYECFV